MKKWIVCLLVVVVCISLSGCTKQLISISPDRVESMEVVDLLSGEKVVLTNEGEGAAIKQQLVGQLQQTFRSTGDCSVDDGHIYQVVIIVDEQVHANIVINSDGSVCNNGTRYVLAEEGKFLDLYTLQTLFSGSAPSTTNAYPYVPDNIERGSTTVLVETETHTYFTENVVMDGSRYTIIGRSSDAAPLEVVLDVPELYGDRFVHSFAYVAHSYEQSGEAMLYFTDFDSDTCVTTLHFFSLETDTIGTVFDGQTSNMVTFEDPDSEIEGVGWVVYDDKIVAVNLSDASANEGFTKTVAELALEGINDHFFLQPNSGNTVKYTKLSVVEDGVLLIEVMEGSDASNTTKIAEFTYDCVDQKIMVEDEA